jgi:succinate dehydrogenase/fumarate reductase flavoprotein subunit
VDKPRDVVEALELDHLLTATEMEARAALMGQETRGAHFRIDCPERNDAEWRRSITVKRVNDAMQLDTLVVDPDWEDRTSNVVSSRWG